MNIIKNLRQRISRWLTEARTPQPVRRVNRPYTNRELMGRLTATLLSTAQLAEVYRQHAKWCRGMQQATGKVFK